MTPIVVMGVSGAGKSTVGVLVGRHLGRPFVDADDLHPPSNKAKMARGVPLDDLDRMPWLATVAEVLARGVAVGNPPVVACSALKRSYRDVLRKGCPTAIFVHLDSDRGDLTARVGAREHEFMSAALLDSQLDLLELLGEDEAGLVVEATGSAETTAAAVLARLDLSVPRP